MRKNFLYGATAVLLSMAMAVSPVMPYSPVTSIHAAASLSMTGWSGADVTNNSDGSCTINYSDKYKTAVYNLPSSINASTIKSVTINATADSQFCVKLCDASGEAFSTDYPAYGLTEATTDNYTYKVDASENTLSQIQIMSLSEQCVTIHSIDFTFADAGTGDSDNGVSLDSITGWSGAQITHNADGTCTVDYSDKYKTAIYNMDSSLDQSMMKSITLNITADSQFCIKLCGTNGEAFLTDYPGYNLSGTTTANYTYRFDASENTLSQIQIMSLSKQSLMINSIRFDYKVAANPDDANYDKSLASLAAKFGFKMGTNISYSTLSDGDYKTLVKKNFNSITASNEMKAYSLLSQSASKADANGMPAMNYSQADAMMQFAQDNGIAVRGHNLVWDAYMCDWFFREDYDTNKAYVDAATAKARLQYYIDAVMTHFEEKFPGVIYCWDVVNEAVDTNNVLVSGDSRCIENNIFSQIIGEDYVELSFKYAKDTVEKLQAKNPKTDIKLFYNDFSTFYNEKRDAICRLINSINSYDKDANGNYRKLCDGVGMQSYIGGYGQQSGCMNAGDISLIKTAVKKFHAQGVEVHVTEMAVRNYQNDEATMAKHAQFYEDLFSAFIDLNSGNDKPLTSVSIWGLCDNPSLSTSDYSYKMNGTYCGLFDENLNMKNSFKKIYTLMNTTDATVTIEPSVEPTESVEPSQSVEPSIEPSESAAPSESVEPSIEPSESTVPSVKPTETAAPEGKDLGLDINVNSWTGAYNANFTLKNTASDQITDWKIYLNTSEVDMGGLWCANKEVSGSDIILTPMDYNKVISAAGSTSFGFGGNGSISSISYKVVYTMNGVTYSYTGMKNL